MKLFGIPWNTETWLLLILGLALRLGYSGYVHTHQLASYRADGYVDVAENLVDRGEFSYFPGKPTAAREPAYPLYIAAIYSIFGKQPFLIFAGHAAMGALTCLLLYALTFQLFGALAGRLAYALAIFYPYFIFYTAYAFRETFLVFVLTLGLYLLSQLINNPNLRLAAVTGLCIGVWGVTFSTYLPVLAVIFLWLNWALGLKKSNWAILAVFLVALSLPASLWFTRNFIVFKRFIPGSTLGGFNFYTALIVPEEFRGTPMEFEYEKNDPHWLRIMKMFPHHMEDDGSQNAAYMKAAGEHIRKNPGPYMGHVIRQIIKLWRFYPYPRQYIHSYRLIKAVSLLSDGWIIPLGVIGLIMFWRISPMLALFALLLCSLSGTYGLVSAIVRYRLPLMVPLIITASALLARALKR